MSLMCFSSPGVRRDPSLYLGGRNATQSSQEESDLTGLAGLLYSLSLFLCFSFAYVMRLEAGAPRVGVEVPYRSFTPHLVHLFTGILCTSCIASQ